MKYDGHRPAPAPLFSERDRKALARLVRSYGADTVARAAMVVEPTGPGRPARGLDPYFERVHLADWLEDRAAEHKANGSRQFARDAVYDLFVLAVGEDEQRVAGRFEAFEKTVKKKWSAGRRDLNDLRERMVARKIAP